MEGDDDMDRRGEAVLPRLLEIRPLIVKIEDEGRRLALGAGQGLAPTDDEAEARHTLDAFVRGGRDRIDMYARQIERERAEGAHGVEEEALAMRGGERADLFDRIEDARGRLAMHREDMGERRRAGEQTLDLGEIGRSVLRRLVHHHVMPGNIEDALGAVAIG